MDLSALRIIFMGTPEFAVSSLDAMLQAGANVVAVVTAPDKPAGRGLRLNESAVKTFAVQKNIPVLQPVKLKDPAFLDQLDQYKADLQVVVAFRMLPEIIWNKPRLGTINLHGSLLPQYRGAAPINWAVINGEKETGVTTFRLKQEIDTGDILLQESFPIGENETAGEVHDKMKLIGARLLVKTLEGIAQGSLKEVPQNTIVNSQNISGITLKHAPKIHTDTCRIDFSKTVEQVHDLVRGLNPFPGAFTILNEKMFKVYVTKKEPCFPEHTEGDPVTDGRTFLKYACSNGYIHLLEVQMEGKKRMEIGEFLRGYRMNEQG